jgi:hypothetical protein
MVMLLLGSIFVKALCNEIDLEVQGHVGGGKMKRDEKRKNQKRNKQKKEERKIQSKRVKYIYQEEYK